MATPTLYKHEVSPHGVLDNNPSDLQSLFFYPFGIYEIERLA
jgi:hypothetical protein